MTKKREIYKRIEHSIQGRGLIKNCFAINQWKSNNKNTWMQTISKQSAYENSNKRNGAKKVRCVDRAKSEWMVLYAGDGTRIRCVRSLSEYEEKLHFFLSSLLSFRLVFLLEPWLFVVVVIIVVVVGCCHRSRQGFRDYIPRLNIC